MSHDVHSIADARLEARVGGTGVTSQTVLERLAERIQDRQFGELSLLRDAHAEILRLQAALAEREDEDNNLRPGLVLDFGIVRTPGQYSVGQEATQLDRAKAHLALFPEVYRMAGHDTRVVKCILAALAQAGAGGKS